MASKTTFDTSVEVNELTVKEIPINGPLCSAMNSRMIHLKKNMKIPIVDDDLRSRRSSGQNLKLSLNVSTRFPSADGVTNHEPFADIRQLSIRELQKRLLPKFKFVSSSIAEYIRTANQLITEEGSRFHIPLKTDNHVVSDFEGKLSSLIVCALVLLKDAYEVSEVDDEVRMIDTKVE
ncbi:hypothetical protein Fmac_009008 [Flemingia macrophylla]|uniref:Uncharacterized protein n=1 Tax=Flemingia macrophylla TaxID=520843 RepID=A0ABD1MZ27_9FABA